MNADKCTYAVEAERVHAIFGLTNSITCAAEVRISLSSVSHTGPLAGTAEDKCKVDTTCVER
jgi:hypothetical protein